MNPLDANSLCRECGLCCNGVIFADVQLRPQDHAARLQALGLKFVANRKFAQPCTAFAGCQCNIYSERPAYCREFECLLLKSVKAGKVASTEALRTIRTALQRVKKIKQLLQKLGDADDTVALGKRFRKMKRTLENGPLDEESAETFGELTLAVHNLNVLLSDKFYPAP